MKVQSCLQKFQVKNEIVDCEVFKKPNVEYIYITSQDTGKHLRSNRNDQLEAQYLRFK